MTSIYATDPVTGGMLVGERHGDDIDWLLIHNGVVEWLGNRQDRADTKARLVARLDQCRSRMDELVNEYPELKSRGKSR